MKRKLRHLDLFSGVGGFALAASWTGCIETVGFVEIDPFCQQVLRKHWPDVPIISDIRDVKGGEFGHIDIITGGFPCQPFSTAGKRRGTGDNRYLWPEMLRVIDSYRPRIVVGENVTGIINLALDTVLSDLEGIGYATRPVVIPACAVDAKHRRDRVWILAHAASIGLQGSGVPRVGYGGGRTDWQADESPRAGAVGRTSTMADTASVGVERRRPARKQEPQTQAGTVIPGRDGSGSGTEDRCAQSGLGGVADGVSYWMDEPVPRLTTERTNRAKRIKALGNAIVPQVAYQVLVAGLAAMDVIDGGKRNG